MYLTRLLQLMSEAKPPTCSSPGRRSIEDQQRYAAGQHADHRCQTAKKIAYEVMNEEEIARFEHDWEMNLSHIEPEFGNFRINILKQRGSVSMVVRYIRQQYSVRLHR